MNIGFGGVSILIYAPNIAFMHLFIFHHTAQLLLRTLSRK